MAESLVTSLLQTLDRPTISGIASHLGESESSVSRALELSAATIFDGMAAKSQDPGALRRVLDLLPGNLGEALWSHLVDGLSSTASPLIAAGNRILLELFGSSDTTIAGALGSQADLTPGKASTLLVIAAPMVMSFLKKKMRDEGMSVSSLASLLQRESSNIRSMLRAETAEQLRPRTMAASASPMIAQAVKRERSSPHCLPALGIMVVSLGCLWLRTHADKPVSMLIGTSERMVNEAPCFSKLMVANLHLPDDPGESRFLAFVRDPRATVDANTWFDFDRLEFNSGSAILRPESGQQLDDIAAVMSACPRVRIKIARRTHRAYSAEANLKLCQARAESVKAALESRGISPDRIAMQGFGEQNPTSENSTMAGRAQNWRVSLQVIQK